jgi:hypothetical protein
MCSVSTRQVVVCSGLWDGLCSEHLSIVFLAFSSSLASTQRNGSTPWSECIDRDGDCQRRSSHNIRKWVCGFKFTKFIQSYSIFELFFADIRRHPLIIEDQFAIGRLIGDGNSALVFECVKR